MKRILFREDRHIYLRRCLINANKPPLSIFNNAKLPYDILTIGYDVKVNLKEFGHHFGTSIKEVIFSNIEYWRRSNEFVIHQTYSILLEMPKVTSLTFEFINLRQVAKIFEKIHTNEPNSFLHNLKTLTFKTSQGKTLIMDSYQSIKQFISNETRIIIEHLSLTESDDVRKHLRCISDSAQFKHLYLDISRLSNADMEALLEISNLNCCFIEFGSEQFPCPLYLEAFFNKHKNIHDVRLHIRSLPPAVEFPQIKALHLDLRQDVKSFKPLEYLVNLEDLLIGLDDWNTYKRCSFDHEPITLKKLRRLRFRGSTFCEKCLNALTKSFPNLKDILILSEDHMTFKTFKLLSNWQYLERVQLVIDHFVMEANGFEEFEEEQSSRTYLRELKIGSSKELSVTADVLTKVGKLFSNIVNISLWSQNIILPSFDKLVRAVVPAYEGTLNKLKVLKISSSNSNIRIVYERKNLAKYLNEHGYKIKVRMKLKHFIYKNVKLFFF